MAVQTFFPSPQNKRCAKLRPTTRRHYLAVQHHQLPEHPPGTTARVRTPGTQTKRSRGAQPAQASCGAPLLHSNFMCGAKHFYSAPCDGKRLNESLSRTTTLGFPEHALPRMCLDCFLEKSPKAIFMTRPAVPSDSNLQAQLSLQSGSTT